jgi:N-acetylmuramoyl-L-alanine amidase
MTTHIVVQGEYLSQIAARHGFASVKPIWDHPDNAALKAKRPDPNVLMPGDRIVIPALESKVQSAATGSVASFQLVEESLTLRLRLLGMGDRPLSGRSCVLAVAGGDHPLVTDGRGVIEQPIGASTSTAELTIDDPEGKATKLVVKLDVGHLDPVSEVSGQRERLRNLGYFADPLEGDDPDEVFRTAVEEFQCDHKLSVDGKCGPGTQAKLREVHGC